MVDERQAVINKLKENHKVRCPKCKCEDFLKKTIERVNIWIKSNSVEADYCEFIDTEEYRCNDCNYKLKDKDFK